MGTQRRGQKGFGTTIAPSIAGKTWGIRWPEAGERKYKGGYRDEAEASKELASIVARVKAGLPGVPTTAERKGRISEHLEAFWSGRKADEHRNHQDDVTRWEKHLSPIVDHLEVSSIGVTTVEALQRALFASKLTGRSVDNCLNLLSAFFRAMKWPNPVREYRAGATKAQKRQLKGKHDPAKTPFLDADEHVISLYRALPAGSIRLAYALSALCGLRPGETVALQWSDIDFNKNRLYVRSRVRHGKLENTTKSGKVREVELVPSMRQVLLDRRTERPSDVLVCPPVRRTKGGKYLEPSTIGKRIRDKLVILKLPPMSFYESGRHTYASLWVIKGLDILRLSKNLGHSSVLVTQRYAHLTNKTPADILARANIAL